VKEIDPTQSSDPRVLRATFLGAGAAAAAGTATFGSAFAQTVLGKPCSANRTRRLFRKTIQQFQ
jgi:hypothetical protein